AALFRPPEQLYRDLRSRRRRADGGRHGQHRLLNGSAPALDRLSGRQPDGPGRVGRAGAVGDARKEMNRFSLPMLLAALVVLMTAAGETNAQEAGGAVTLTVRLRAADGEPLAGEPVVLQRLPDEQ